MTRAINARRLTITILVRKIVIKNHAALLHNSCLIYVCEDQINFSET